METMVVKRGMPASEAVEAPGWSWAVAEIVPAVEQRFEK